jgi:long-chain acyl-CoA synthetase
LTEDEALNEDEFKSAILKDMNELAKDSHLTSLEKIHHIYLAKDPFTVENDLMTPTFKIKRNIAKERFKREIDQLY